MPKKTQPIYTMERRVNSRGEVAFRAIYLLKDRAIDGWGKTPEEAHLNLKMSLIALGIAFKKRQL